MPEEIYGQGTGASNQVPEQPVVDMQNTQPQPLVYNSQDQQTVTNQPSQPNQGPTSGEQLDAQQSFSTEALSQAETQNIPQNKGNKFFNNAKMSIMRWQPLLLLFNTVIAGTYVLSFGLPLFIFSLATVWSMGLLYAAWTSFYFISLMAEFIIYLLAFMAVYRRKPSAYGLVRAANIFLIVSVAINALSGEGFNFSSIMNLIIPVVTLLAINQFRNYFDTAVSGDKGLTLGDVSPGKKEKILMYGVFSVAAVTIVVGSLIVGTLLSIVSGVAAGANMLNVPFIKVNNDYSQSLDKSSSSPKTTNNKESFDDLNKEYSTTDQIMADFVSKDTEGYTALVPKAVNPITRTDYNNDPYVANSGSSNYIKSYFYNSDGEVSERATFTVTYSYINTSGFLGSLEEKAQHFCGGKAIKGSKDNIFKCESFDDYQYTKYSGYYGYLVFEKNANSSYWIFVDYSTDSQAAALELKALSSKVIGSIVFK